MTTMLHVGRRPPSLAQLNRAMLNRTREQLKSCPHVARRRLPWVLIADVALAAIIGASAGIMLVCFTLP